MIVCWVSFACFGNVCNASTVCSSLNDKNNEQFLSSYSLEGARLEFKEL